MIPSFICFIFLSFDQVIANKKNYYLLLFAFVGVVQVHLSLVMAANIVCLTFFIAFLIRMEKMLVDAVFISICSMLIASLCKSIIGYIYLETSLHKWPMVWGELVFYLLFILMALPILLGVRFIYGKVRLEPSVFSFITLLLCFVYFGLLIDELFDYIGNYDGVSSYGIFIALFVASFVFLALFILYNDIMRKRMETLKKAEEVRLTEQFVKDVSMQNEEINQFKHDYHNILLSLDYFIEHQEWQELKVYFNEIIRPSEDSIEKIDLSLIQMEKISNPELKSILQNKLFLLQGTNIRITFNVVEEILVKRTASLALVRVLGIILDNAVEELNVLNEGELDILFAKEEGSVVVKVSNTCQQQIKDISQFKSKGYSTKGNNRGLGLSNLQEIAYDYDFVVETVIKNGKFIQKIILEVER